MKTIKKGDFTADPARGRVRAVAYHRNGIGGESFHVVHFTYDGQELLGVVHTTCDEDGYLNGIDSRTGVINPLDINDTKRGYDYFGAYLYEAIKAHNREQFRGDDGTRPRKRVSK